MQGNQTQEVDGQRNTFPSSYAFSPTHYGAQTTGVPQVSPTAPPFMAASAGPGMGGGAPSSGGGSGGAAAGTSMVGVDGYGTSDNNALVTQIASENPHHWRVSPVWWTVGMFIVGIFLLRVVHWRSIPGA